MQAFEGVAGSRFSANRKAKLAPVHSELQEFGTKMQQKRSISN
jgi:hypothetical protein